jgi:CubicO group peptidase (beta-lactamase class C family)
LAVVNTPNPSQVHRFLSTVAVVLAVATFGHRSSAQTLTSSLFERYLESLREQAGIPGMSAVIVQNGVIVWQQGFGLADVETGQRAEPHTPYLIGDVSQTFGATLLLRKCIDQSFATINDPVAQWVPGFNEPATTLGHLIAHITPGGAFQYDRARFAALTPVIEACSKSTYRKLLDDEIFVRFGMVDSAPGTAMATPTAEDRELFDADRLAEHAAVLRRVATPYSVDARGRAETTTLAPTGVDAAFGIVSSVRDLAYFDDALSSPRNLLLEPGNRDAALTRATPQFPTGLGWFVQDYNGSQVVWQFGVIDDAYSSLIVKLPSRRLTFVLLANSDKLNTPFALEDGDVTESVFARLFLRIYFP